MSTETSLELHRVEMIRLLEKKLVDALEVIEWGRPVAFTTAMLLEVLDRVVARRSQPKSKREQKQERGLDRFITSEIDGAVARNLTEQMLIDSMRLPLKPTISTPDPIYYAFDTEGRSTCGCSGCTDITNRRAQAQTRVQPGDRVVPGIHDTTRNPGYPEWAWDIIQQGGWFPAPVKNEITPAAMTTTASGTGVATGTRTCSRALPQHPVELNPDEVCCWRCGNREF